MKRTHAMMWAVGLMLSALVVMPGCDGGGGDSGPSVDVTGRWRISSLGELVYTMDLVQSGSNVSGTMTDDEGDRIPLTSGFVSGKEVTLKAVGGDASITWTGTVEDPSISGTMMLVKAGQEVATLAFAGGRI